MVRSQGKSFQETKSGFYFFVATWLGSEVQKCSDSAKGFWVDCLCHMYQSEPRGVLPADPVGLAEAFGVDPDLAEAWFDSKSAALDELERKDVFSRGEDVDLSLDADAIVNRRMYRDYVKEFGRHTKAKRAARARWSRDAKACSSRARGDARGDAKADGDSATSKRLTKCESCSGDAKGDARRMPFPTEPYPTQCNSAEAKSYERPKGSRVTRVGEDLAAIFGGVPLDERALAASGDDADQWGPWWRSVVDRFGEQGFIGDVEALVKRVEDARDPRIRTAKDIGEFKQPGKWLSSQVCRIARERRVRIPNMPTGGRNA